MIFQFQKPISWSLIVQLYHDATAGKVAPGLSPYKHVYLISFSKMRVDLQLPGAYCYKNIRHSNDHNGVCTFYMSRCSLTLRFGSSSAVRSVHGIHSSTVRMWATTRMDETTKNTSSSNTHHTMTIVSRYA